MEELKRDLNVYFKVFGLGQTEDGTPCYAGMKMTLGMVNKDVQYSEIKEKLTSAPDWRKQILELTHLNDAGIKPEAIEIIAPEEYERDYGNEDDE